MNTHRRFRTRLGARSSVTLLATMASLTAVTGSAPASAQQVSSGRATSKLVMDEAHSRANYVNPDDRDVQFSIHELGTALGVGVRNQAVATSGGCSLDEPCRSIAVSFQIVTTAGAQARTQLNAVNAGRAVNSHCDACETYAGAFQFIIATPGLWRLPPDILRQLAAVQRKLDRLEAADDPIAVVSGQAEALAREVVGILNKGLASAPKGSPADPRSNFTPSVTLRRHIR
ncbi:hypothetical protein [Streptomyces sp. NPDC092307]|uniref:hypothetical protein n=1 Tax=Streptomyces sp. NPDC092307 TaxID=3366013 RepID=UPI00382F7FF5